MLPALHFIPSHREEFFSRLNKLSADSFIFDLEDGVPAHLRADARSLLRSKKDLIEDLNAFIRINKVNGIYEEADIQLIKEIEVKGVVIPKVESVEEIKKFLGFFDEAQSNFKIICLIESFRGLEELSRICKNTGEKLFAIGLGLEDFLSEIPVLKVQNKIIDYIKLKLVSTCRAYDQLCIDTVSLNYNDKLDKFKKECLESRDLLFDGRFSIHPTQIPLISEIYSPTKDEITWAQRILDQVNGQSNIGYMKVENEVISEPKVKKARLILKKSGYYDV